MDQTEHCQFEPGIHIPVGFTVRKLQKEIRSYN